MLACLFVINTKKLRGLNLEYVRLSLYKGERTVTCTTGDSLYTFFLTVAEWREATVIIIMKEANEYTI